MRLTPSSDLIDAGVKLGFRSVQDYNEFDDSGNRNSPHVFKMNWHYELPFGQGRRFGAGAGPVLDRIIGGWSLSLVSRIQSGRLVDFGNARTGASPDAMADDVSWRWMGVSAWSKVFAGKQAVVDELVRAEKIAIPLNILLTGALLFLVFGMNLFGLGRLLGTLGMLGPLAIGFVLLIADALLIVTLLDVLPEWSVVWDGIQDLIENLLPFVEFDDEGR